MAADKIETEQEHPDLHECYFSGNPCKCVTCGRLHEDAAKEAVQQQAGPMQGVGLWEPPTEMPTRTSMEIREIALQHAVDVFRETGNKPELVLHAAKEFEAYLSKINVGLSTIDGDCTAAEEKREGVVSSLLRPGEKPFSPAFDAWNEDTEFKPPESATDKEMRAAAKEEAKRIIPEGYGGNLTVKPEFKPTEHDKS